MVHDGTVYLYASHDEDQTLNDFFTMNDWRVFSSKDIVNWTDHGSPLGYLSFAWASGDAWAGQCVARNGKFYWYVPITHARLGRPVIGVAVADSPLGPFTDPLDQPLVDDEWGYIDPTVFIDTDGQAYLYWGNPGLWYVKLNEDMISYSGQIESMPLTTASFGARNGDPDRATLYEEGPWFYKRNDLYYMLFAAAGIPEDISYATSPGPTGPWSYQGVIMPHEGGSFTNHSGVIDFKGRSFFFYHNGALPGGGGYKRSVSVEEFSYGADGAFPSIGMSADGPRPVENLNPYARNEGETIAWSSGVETEDSSGGGRNVTSIDNGDSIKVASVDFLTGAVSFEASVASESAGGTLELHLDGVDGPLVGTCAVPPTGGWQSWSSVSCSVENATDVHDLYLVFKGGSGSLFNLDWWRFAPRDPVLTDSGGVGASGGTEAGGSASDAGAGGCALGMQPNRSLWPWLACGALVQMTRRRTTMLSRARVAA